MWLFIIICIVVGIIIMLVSDSIKSNEAKKELLEIKNSYAKNILEADQKYSLEYGVITKSFHKEFNEIESIRVFEESETIVIMDVPYKFVDIISVELYDDSKIIITNSVTKTSTGSMIGRAVVGGALIGGVGAVIGGVSAKQNTVATQETSHHYCMYITINNLTNPLISFVFKGGVVELDNTKESGIETYWPIPYEKIMSVVSMISVIIERNKRLQKDII
ncbi:MAG: hypothetical protein A2X18_07090 [Bacteroidetes bacterium GWF2_40_14]|nr:MAG: hypothetical protein A2X18_07090 [Bacteroidetes bacterium GWF2_40_14]